MHRQCRKRIHTSVLRDSFADARRAFAEMLAKSAHAASERRTRVQRPTMPHVSRKAARTVADAAACVRVSMSDSAMAPSPEITAPSMSCLRVAGRRVCGHQRSRI